MQRILFVCTGNTCRSPMAEAILKNKNIDGVEVKSSGIFAINGGDASTNAKQVLVENKIEHQHQSTSLTHKEVEWATLILTMTSSHKAAIAENFPAAAQKTFTLKEFIGKDGDVDVDVSDPFGGDIDMYRKTFNELEKLIDAAIIRLKEKPST
jgi:protein arginine phosphatase